MERSAIRGGLAANRTASLVDRPSRIALRSIRATLAHDRKTSIGDAALAPSPRSGEGRGEGFGALEARRCLRGPARRGHGDVLMGETETKSPPGSPFWRF